MLNNPAIYVHIPFCKARCGYCDFSSCTDFSLCDKYFDWLFKQIDDNPTSQISTIFIGGGTPSSVGVYYLDLLFEKLKHKFDLSAVTEITVECNPESVNKQLMQCLFDHGVNRISFGLQSVNDSTLKKIGRLHSYQGFLDALEVARQVGFTNINADLIIGLPETQQEFFHSIDTVCQLPLTHVSVYALELHEHCAIYNLCKTEYNYDDDQLADMYDYAYNKLTEHGFLRYEVSNFAKAGCECQHNLNYWRQGRYYGFGASACGFDYFCRYQNPHSIQEYLATPIDKLKIPQEIMSTRDQANEFAMLALRLTEGLSYFAFCDAFSEDFFEFFPNARKLQQQGFIVEEGEYIKIPQDKFYVLNSILCELLNFDE